MTDEHDKGAPGDGGYVWHWVSNVFCDWSPIKVWHERVGDKVVHNVATDDDVAVAEWGPRIDPPDVAAPKVRDESADLRAALQKVSDIRDSIIGAQSINWSEHIYPLVAVLREAGFEGVGYDAARENLGTLLGQVAALQERVRELDEANTKLREELTKSRSNIVHRERNAARDERDALREQLAATENRAGYLDISLNNAIGKMTTAQQELAEAQMAYEGSVSQFDCMRAEAQRLGRALRASEAELAAARKRVEEAVIELGFDEFDLESAEYGTLVRVINHARDILTRPE